MDVMTLLDVDDTVIPSAVTGPHFLFEHRLVDEVEIADRIFFELRNVHWMTAWDNEAKKIFDAPVIPSRRESPIQEMVNGLWWKLDAVVEFFKSNGVPNKLIWVDDELGEWSNEITQVFSDNFPTLDFLLVTPEFRVGLTDAQLEEAAQF